MLKRAHLVLWVAIFFSCTNNSEKGSKASSDVDQSAILKFAVVWNWTTDDMQIIRDNYSKISEEITELWNDDILENAYYNSESPSESLDFVPNISFFMKSLTVDKARSVLNDLTLVKSGIADYTLYPVGTLWLGRQDRVIMENGLTHSYVAVWSTESPEEIDDDLLRKQNDVIMKLWNEGKIENVYFDIEGTRRPNTRTDFVFFVNVRTEEEAWAICRSLPFAEREIATFKLYKAGLFWLGQNSKD